VRQAVMFLGKYNISAPLAIRIYRQYKEDTYRIIRENPYQLAEDMRGVGFLTADEIARSAGIGIDSRYRIRSGILYTLQNALQDGHTCMNYADLADQAARLLQVSEDQVKEQCGQLEAERKVRVVQGGRGRREAGVHPPRLPDRAGNGGPAEGAERGHRGG